MSIREIANQYGLAYSSVRYWLKKYGVSTSGNRTGPISEGEWRYAIANSDSIAQALRILGIQDAGGNYRLFHLAASRYSIDASHFRGQSHGRSRSGPRVTDDELFKRESFYTGDLLGRLRRAGHSMVCASCGCGEEWNGTALRLQIHHINGDSRDNRLGNLAVLCPNCHSQTNTFSGKNKHS